jgi:large subunit ribosomal protein L21
MSRALLRSVLELRAPITRLTPSSSLLRPTAAAPAVVAAATAPAARFFNQTAQHIEPTQQQPDPTILTQQPALPSSTSSFQQPQKPLPTQPPPPPATPLSESARTLLPVLAAQPGHYITILIHGRPYLVTEGDSVRLPFKMPGVEPGNILRLTRASVLGSRDLTLRGAPYVDERLFECRAVVTGTESEPMRAMVKKKRRCRRKLTVKSKHRYTMLRICELRVRGEAVDEC